MKNYFVDILVQINLREITYFMIHVLLRILISHQMDEICSPPPLPPRKIEKEKKDKENVIMIFYMYYNICDRLGSKSYQ